MKVRFELNIDEIVEVDQFPNCRDEIFKGADAEGKTFLFVDKLTGEAQAMQCITPSSDNKELATVHTFFMPPTTTVVTEEEGVDHKHEALMLHIQDCCDKVCQTIQTYADIADSKHSVILQGLRPVLEKIEEGGTGNGISEKTLLDALKIVSK